MWAGLTVGSGLLQRGSPYAPWLALAAGLFALGIFSVDTFTDLGIAVAVLYVVVILIAGSLLRQRGILLVSGGCVVATVGSFLLSHGESYQSDALVRCLMSLSAIGITTVLAVRGRSAGLALMEQARLLDLTHDAIFVRDLNDRITYWNRGAEELYGWSADEARGRNSHDLMQTVFSLPLETIRAELLQADRWEGQLLHRRRDGSEVIVASRWSIYRDERGRPAGVMETNTDITSWHRTQEELDGARSELAHVTRVMTLGELTASIAHEINQPLAAIVTNGEASLRWLKREPPDLGEVRGSVERMIADGRRASQVVARLRALAKKTDPQKAELQLDELVLDTLALVQRELAGQGVAVRLELAEGLPPATGDRVQLQQVIINLVVNAIQAMAQVADRPRTLLLRTDRTEDGELRVAVVDSGAGIDAGAEARLFKAFFTTKADGMGMGLSICRSIIDQHGGRIWATPNEAGGATFAFTLPTAGVDA